MKNNEPKHIRFYSFALILKVFIHWFLLYDKLIVRISFHIDNCSLFFNHSHGLACHSINLGVSLFVKLVDDKIMFLLCSNMG